MKIALLGAGGQLATDLEPALAGGQIHAIGHRDLDVTDHARARAVLGELRPDTIINTAAYHRVDECESQPELAFAVNALAALNLARVANELGAILVHFSSDYVFDGRARAPYTEEHCPRPLSVYGNSKLAGEHLVGSASRKCFLIRSCGLYGAAGSSGKGGNFVETIVRKARAGEEIRVVSDQVVTPTYTVDLARQIGVLIETDHCGLFHITNEGCCSWYEFARAICELARLPVDVEPTTSQLYKTPAIRPKYSVLENHRLKQLGLNTMRPWRQALAAYLKEKHGID